MDIFPQGHDLDRVPCGLHDLPLAMLNGLRAEEGGRRRSRDARQKASQGPIWLHSDRPGVYELVSGEQRLVDDRKAQSASAKVRITHHPRWLANSRKPDEYQVALGAPSDSSRPNKAPGPMTSAELRERILCPAQPTLPSVLATLSGYHVEARRGQLRVSTDLSQWREVPSISALLADPAAPLPSRCPIEATARLAQCNMLPEAWKRFPPFAWADVDGRWAQLPQTAEAVAVTVASDGAIEGSFGLLDELAARLRLWGISHRARHIVCVAPRAELDHSAKSHGFLGRRGNSVPEVLLAIATRATLGKPKLALFAHSVSAPLSDYPLLAVAIAGSVIWDQASIEGMTISELEDEDPTGDQYSWHLRESLYQRTRGPFRDLPNPFKPIVECYATGLIPMALDKRGVMIGVPSDVDRNIPKTASRWHL